uniref:Uncharacterized protein n=1 Tax=Rhizophora mucronata TaxID=61149 RepID=A0A2P2N595_RHIMU
MPGLGSMATCGVCACVSAIAVLNFLLFRGLSFSL